MTDYVPPSGDSIQFTFSIQIQHPVSGQNIPFVWSTESEVFLVLGDVTGLFTGVDPRYVTLSLILADFATAFTLERGQAWAGPFISVLDDCTTEFIALTPIPIEATLDAVTEPPAGDFLVHYVTAITVTLSGTFADDTTDFLLLTPIQLTFTFDVTLANVTGVWVGRHTFGTWASTFANSTVNFHGIVPLPLTGTLSRTLANLVPNLRLLHYHTTFATTTASITTTITLLTPIAITGDLSRTLADATVNISSRFAGVQGYWASTLIKTATVFYGGATIGVTLNGTLSTITTDLRFRTPLNITGTLDTTLSNLNRVLTGKAWPTGSITKTLSNIVSNICGTLPLVITGSFFAYTYPLIPYFRLGAWPTGHFNKMLLGISSTIYLKTPIQINVSMPLVTTSVVTTLTCRCAIAGYVQKPTESVYMSWYLQHQIPRAGVLSSVLRLTGLFYAKIINYGHLNATLQTFTSGLAIRVPIRIYVTFDITTGKFNPFLIRGKAEIGGPLDTTTTLPTFSGFGTALIGLNWEPILSDITTQFFIRVPIAIVGFLTKTLANLQSSISGRGHHIPIFHPTLASIKINFHVLTTMLGVINLHTFNGPFITVNKFYNGTLGEKWPIHSGKYWKLQIFANNGNQSTTSFKKISLLSRDASGELVDVLEGVPQAENFSVSNAQYATEDGMLWTYVLPQDTEIEAYEIDGA